VLGRADIRLPHVARWTRAPEDLEVDAGVARRADDADRRDAIRVRCAAREDVRPPARRDRALSRGEPPARVAPGAPTDGRPLVLRARADVLLRFAGPRLPRRRLLASKPRHDHGLHDPPDAAAVPDREHAPDVGRGAGVARAVR